MAFSRAPLCEPLMMLLKCRQTEHEESVLRSVSNYRSSSLWMMILKKKCFSVCPLGLATIWWGGHRLVAAAVLKFKVQVEVNTQQNE